MIPKIIHYCWFGGNPMPEIVIKCIESWKKYCPDYQIIRWDESNYDVNKNDYIKEAYKAKKWAFVSDYARLDVVYNCGGIYLDSDVELIKNLDSLLIEKCFLAEETTGFVATGLGFGAEKNNEIIAELLATYDNAKFYISKGVYDTTPCPRRNSKPLYKYGYKFSGKDIYRYEDKFVVFPPEYFSPIDYVTKELKITINTLGIHRYTATWVGENQKQLEILEKNIKESNLLFKFLRIQILKYKCAKKDKDVKNVFQYIYMRIKCKLYMKRKK